MSSKEEKKELDQSGLYGTIIEPAFSGSTSFLRRKATRDLDGIDLVVTGIPLDTATTNRPGARFGPRAIRAASTHMAWERPYGMKFDPFDRLAVVDYGDCLFDFGKPESISNDIESHIETIINQGPCTLSFGGDHFVTYPILKAYAKKYQTPISLIHFDAHSDTWRDDEEERIDHGTMFYKAMKQGIIDPKKSVQIGLRTENPDTFDFNILDGDWVHKNGNDAVIEKTLSIVGNRPVYMTFDIDCLDPSYAPGTGTPVCGGLTTHQAMSIIRGFMGINLIGMDVVEVAPAYDVSEITALAASHIAMEMISVFASKPEFDS
tara:strand:- start:1555 stop:2514 length:960 start_codon:yes stop_codon:yes gene_type:complete